MPAATTSVALSTTGTPTGSSILEQRQTEQWPNGPKDVKNLSPDIMQKLFGCFSFDDGYQDIYNYSLIADGEGIPITAFLHPTLIDAPQGEALLPFITSANVIAMHAAGHEIAGHGLANADYRTFDYAECLAKFKSVNAMLESILGGDYRCLTMAWPMNYHDAVSRAAAEAVYIGARGGFTHVDWETMDEMSPPSSHTPQLMAAYMVPKVSTIENLVLDESSASQNEAAIRAELRTTLQTAVNGSTFAIFGGHNSLEGSLAEFEYIANEAALDPRFEWVTFSHLVRWARERVPRGNVNQWIASYNRRFFWVSASASTFSYQYFDTGGPRGGPFLRLTNTTGSEATYRFRHDTYAGEEMTFSAYVRGVVADTPTLVSSAVQLRLADTDDASHDAPATWTRISHTRTPGATDDLYSGFALQASVTIDIAMPQLEVGTLSPWSDPFPYATT